MNYTVDFDNAVSQDIERRSKKAGMTPEEWIKDRIENYCFSKLVQALKREVVENGNG